MDALDYVLWIGLAGVLLFLYLRSRHRATEMRALAARLGLHYFDDTVPRSFTTDGTELAFISSVWNVIEGEIREVRIMAFDCRIGMGKGSRVHTVIAAHSTASAFRRLMNQPDLVFEGSGEWQWVYRTNDFPSGLMTIEELGAWLNSIPSGQASK